MDAIQEVVTSMIEKIIYDIEMENLLNDFLSNPITQPCTSQNVHIASVVAQVHTDSVVLKFG